MHAMVFIINGEGNMPASLSFKNGVDAPIANANIKKIVYEDDTGNKYTFGVDNITNIFNTFKYDPNGLDPEVDYSATATKFMTGGAIATLLDIGTNVDAIKTKTDKMPADLTAKVTAIETATNAANLGNKVTAIQAKTDTIPADLGADVTSIKAKTDKMPADLNAELNKLATSASLSTLDGKVDTIKTNTDKIADIGTNVGAIQTKTDKMPANLSTELGTLAKSADVTDIKAKTDKMPADLSTELGTLAKSADVTDIKAKTDKMPADLNAELIKLTAIGNAINGNGNVAEAAKAVLESSFKQAIEQAGGNGSDWLEKSVTNIVSQPKFDIPATDDAALNWTW